MSLGGCGRAIPIMSNRTSVNNTTPTDRELEALKVLWNEGDATVRDICNAMRIGGSDLAYTTVLSLLQVMEQKGLVGHRRVGRAYVYFAMVGRDPTFRQLAGSFLERVFDGAVDEYLVHALDSRRIDAQELAQLEQMIANAKAQTTEHPDTPGTDGASQGKNGDSS